MGCYTFLGTPAKLRKATVSFVMSICSSVCPHGETPLPMDRSALNLMFEYFSEICSENSKFYSNMTRITSTLHEGIFTFITRSRLILLIMRNLLDKSGG
jgi:hypothetical protein